MDWFPYDMVFRHERVEGIQTLQDHSATDLVLYVLKRKYPNAEVLLVEVSPDTKV